VCTGKGIESLVVVPASFTASGKLRGASAASVTLSDEALERFDQLRAVRKKLADAEGVPAYIVFSDAALRGMAERCPTTPEELLGVPGVGPVKLERYGEAFLEALRGS
jgi:ATP-dependent DNA helicase RecQ